MAICKSRNYLQTMLGILIVVVVLGFSGTAHGLLFLQDQNSTVAIDPSTQHGMYDWIIDGNNLAPVYGAAGGDDDYRQWFWYRVGATAEASIDTLPLAVAGASDSNFDGFNDKAFLRYLGGGLKIEVTYTLTGSTAGSGVSHIGEQISITNTGAEPLSLSFFQYGDFMLNAPNVGGETITFENPNQVRESGASGYVMETVNTPVAQHREAEPFPITINKLNDGAPDNLVDNAGASGDVTWAYQWDYTLAPNETVLISKVKDAVIPEPTSMALTALGLIALVFAKRRR
jgi:hypothetical protein